MPGVLTMLSFMMVYFREMPYNQYTDNQKSRFMSEILRYHPIDKKEIWKNKMLNFFYIIVFLFVFPITGVLTFDLIAKKVGE